MTSTIDGKPYWSVTPAAIAAALGCGLEGLSAAQAAARLAVVGSNTLDEAREPGALRLLLRQFANPLVLILSIAVLLALVLGEWINAIIIVTIVLGSALLSVVQEYRANSAVAELKKRLALSSRVIRDGHEQQVPPTTLVPGDVIVLKAGDLIPADGVVIEAADFLVTEASLTGESFPVEKRPGIVGAEASLAGRSNCVFLGASVRSGMARVLLVETGRRTAFGAVSVRLRDPQPETDFQRGVRHFGNLLLRVMLAIVPFVLIVNALLDRPLVDSLLFAVALAVGLSPELLPAIITVTLSAGARHMSRRGVIVRRLAAIENLGSMDVLCTDKTGTLTEGRIVLSETLDEVGRDDPEVRRLAFLNAALESGIDNPLDQAIVRAGQSAGLDSSAARKIDEIPYDFRRRRLTIVLAERDSADRHLVITKGAFANVLEICSTCVRDGQVVPLDDLAREALIGIFRTKSAAGFRVLALATRSLEAQRDYTRGDERDMMFRGFLVFFDPPKAEARSTIRDLGRLGITIKVLSGDNRFVTAHLAREIGLDAESVLTGAQITTLTDEALQHLAPRTTLFVEIDPQQKERIVRALQRAGHAVGYLGDGINDAPAMHSADVGISVDDAVDVARQSADIVLLRRDLDVLRSGVEEGRRSLANTLKYISITTSANFGNMMSMALAAPLLPFLPLSAMQILLNNFLSDLPSLAISTDRVDAVQMRRPQRWSTREIRRFMIIFGLLSSLFDLLTFFVLLKLLSMDEAHFQTGWFMVSLLTELAVVLVLRTRGPTLRSRPSRLLVLSTVAVLMATLVIPYLDGPAALFGFVPLSAAPFAAVFLIVIGYILATEAAKKMA